MALEYPIDENGLLVLRLEPRSDGGVVQARLFSHYSAKSELVKNILPLMSFDIGGDNIKPGAAEFELPLPPHGAPVSLRINNQPFADFAIKGDAAAALETHRKLSVFEARMMGRAPQSGVPYSHEDLRAIRTPITDLHTHFSGQVSADDLLEMGKNHKTLYPTAALDRLGIEYSRERLTTIPKRLFLPLAHLQDTKQATESAVPVTDISASGLKTLRNAMSLSPENQCTFEDIEMAYYLREPFTKNKELLPEIIRKVAQQYHEQGIEYAELSSNAVIDPEWLQIVHQTLSGPGGTDPATGVKLRFLAGLPRNLDEHSLETRIEKIKRVAASPFVVGVDLLGFEMNKTSHLQEQLEDLAGWISERHPEMILRVHAGENPKNLENVKEGLQVAKKFGVRVRIGHAVYGIDDETIELARELARDNKLIIEFNPDSNMAGNNIDFPADIPIARFLNEAIPSVLCSDGADIYRTSAKQTAMAGLFCGVTPDGFDFINDVERVHIRLQDHLFRKKQLALPVSFFESLARPPSSAPPAKAVPFHPTVDAQKVVEAARGKRPVFMAGAAGSSWDMVNAEGRQELVIGFRMMLDYMDPDKVDFVTGRTKDRGVGIELGKAIDEYNAAHDKKFDYTLMLAEGQNGVPYTPKGFNHKVEMNVPLVFLPNAILRFVKEHDGLAYFAGGKAFTRDFIVEAAKQDIPFGLMSDVNGASADKARIYTGRSFEGAVGMVRHAMRLHPELFTHIPDDQELQKAYTAHKRAVATGIA